MAGAILTVISLVAASPISCSTLSTLFEDQDLLKPQLHILFPFPFQAAIEVQPGLSSLLGPKAGFSLAPVLATERPSRRSLLLKSSRTNCAFHLKTTLGRGPLVSEADGSVLKSMLTPKAPQSNFTM